MPHCRAPKPGSRYYLPPESFRVAVGICRNYKNLKKELNALDGWHGSNQDGQPRGSGTSDPTAREGEKRAAIAAEIRLIESTVKECAGSVLYPYILDFVTDARIGVKTLEARGMPCTRKLASCIRREVYYKIYHRRY